MIFFIKPYTSALRSQNTIANVSQVFLHIRILLPIFLLTHYLQLFRDPANGTKSIFIIFINNV